MNNYKNGCSEEPSLKQIEVDMPSSECKSWYIRWLPSDYQFLMRTCHGILGNEEFCEGLRKIDEEQTLQYWCSRLALRLSLTRYTDFAISPESWNIVKMSSGKLVVKNSLIKDNHIDVSISHSYGVVVCAVSRETSVGIDIEAANRKINPALINKTIFSAVELKHLRSKTAKERNSLALKLWTLKEACAKATGLGMRMNFSDMDLLGAETGQFKLQGVLNSVDPLQNWRLKQHVFQRHYILSIATATAAPLYRPTLEAGRHDYV